MQGDPDTQLIVSGEGIIKRDEYIFELAVRKY